jgi:hypothetical protein
VQLPACFFEKHDMAKSINVHRFRRFFFISMEEGATGRRHQNGSELHIYKNTR